MTEDEARQLKNETFPATVDGVARPTESIPTDMPYSEEMPHMIYTDFVNAAQPNLFYRQLLSNDKAVNDKLTKVLDGTSAVKEATHAESADKATEAESASRMGNLAKLKTSTEYAVGDICYHDSLPSWAYLECVTAGTTDNTELDFGGGSSTLGAGDLFTDGTAVFKLKDYRCKYSIGQIVAMMGTPKDYDYMLLCDGSTISETDYKDLVDVLGSSTLPDLVGRVLQGADTAGEYKEAGLPNITGSTNPRDVMLLWGEGWTGNTGAFKNSYSMSKVYSSGSALDSRGALDFDASLSNAIYGNSDTVQPPAMTVKYYICYAG